MLIRDICKEAKHQQRKTNQAIADESGIPLNTVNNYFSVQSKAPSVYTVGPICAALGVSLDAYFGISQPTAAPDASAELHLQHAQDKIAMMENSIRHKNRLIFGFMLLLVLALAYGITIDILNPDMGLFRY